MGSTLETVVFYFLAAFIIAMSIMTVTTQRIVRSATYLLFVLFGITASMNRLTRRTKSPTKCELFEKSAQRYHTF